MPTTCRHCGALLTSREHICVHCGMRCSDGGGGILGFLRRLFTAAPRLSLEQIGGAQGRGMRATMVLPSGSDLPPGVAAGAASGPALAELLNRGGTVHREEQFTVTDPTTGQQSTYRSLDELPGELRQMIESLRAGRMPSPPARDVQISISSIERTSVRHDFEPAEHEPPAVRPKQDDLPDHGVPFRWPPSDDQ